MNLSPEQFREVDALFQQACVLGPVERSALLERCLDPLVRTQVELLLAHDAAPQITLQSPLSGAAVAEAAAVPRQIGEYRIIGTLGSGGMGTVYEAEQDHPRRRVALKVIRPGLITRQLLRRFEHEADILGRLHHPGIAHIYHAAVADIGCGSQPYFAMELIRGRTLSDHVREQRLGMVERLQLLARICDAVHYAHLRGVIHRDLKPANILVEDGGQPKILDFGVARVADAEAQISTMMTSPGQVIGTVQYMSPEQVSGNPDAVDVRSDVFALGVIAFEMLGGALPRDLGNRGVAEAIRAIQEEEPTRLGKICADLRGDVETIVGKALEKDRQRRYSSAGELADDIRRYLRDEPIAARPPSRTYLVRKFVRRHRGAVAGVAMVFMAVAAGAVVSTILYLQARAQQRIALAERDHASTARDQAEAVQSFLQDMLLSADPRLESRPDLTVRELLDRASGKVAERFAARPNVEAEVRYTIGVSYLSLGRYRQAEPHLSMALDLMRSSLGPDDPRTLEVVSELARMCRDDGRYDEAGPLMEEVLHLRRARLGEEHADTLEAMARLAGLYRHLGDNTRAAPLLEKVLESRRRLLGEADPFTLTAAANLASLLLDQGRLAEAGPLLERTLSLRAAVLGADHFHTVQSQSLLAEIYRRQGRFAIALPLQREALRLRRTQAGDHHSDTMSMANELGIGYLESGRLADAEPIMLEALLWHRQTRPGHPNTFSILNNLGQIYFRQGRYAEAEPMFTEAYTQRCALLGRDHPHTLISMNNLAQLYKKLKRHDEALPLLEEGLALSRQRLGPEHPHTVNCMHNLAAMYDEQGRGLEALELYRMVLDLQRRLHGERHLNTLVALHSLGNVHTRLGRAADAEALYEQALAGARLALPSRHWLIGAFLCSHGELLSQQARWDASEAALSEATGLLESALGPQHERTVRARTALEKVRSSRDSMPIQEDAHKVKVRSKESGSP